MAPTHYAEVGARATVCGLVFAAELDQGRGVTYVTPYGGSLDHVDCPACRRALDAPRKPDRPRG